MRTKTFGWAGVQVPVIGQGTWLIEGEPQQERRSIEALCAGIQAGMTHIDTAEMYGSGRAEELVGESIARQRESVFLVSKVLPSNASYEGTLRACEASLQRLRTDHLDLYLLHWESHYPIGETMRAMEKLVADRLTTYIGVSNFDVPQLRAAQKALRHERLLANQVLYHLGDRGIERKLIPYCAEHQIAVVGYSPFGHRGGFPPRKNASRILSDIAAHHNATPRQVVLQFLTRNEAVFTIPKSSDPAHTLENAASLDFTLSDDEVSMIDRAFPAPDHDVPLGMI